MTVSRNFQFTGDNYGLQRDIIPDYQRYVGGSFWSNAWKIAKKFAMPLIQKALPALRKTAFGKIEDYVSKGIGKASTILESGRQKLRDKLPAGIVQDIFDEGTKISKDILGSKTRELLGRTEEFLNKKYDFIEERAGEMVAGAGLKEDIVSAVMGMKGKARKGASKGQQFLEKQLEKQLGVGKEFMKKKKNIIEDFAKDLISGSGVKKNPKAQKLIRQFLKNRNI